MADFLDVTSGNDKRKQLLAWLMQRLAQQSGSSDMAGGALQAAASFVPSGLRVGGGGLRTVFNRSDSRHSDPNITHASHVGLGLGGLLGPGGFGTPGAHEHSAGPGLPATPPARPVTLPRGGAHGGSILPVQPQVSSASAPAPVQAAPQIQTRPNQAGPGSIVFDPVNLILKRI